MKEELWKSVGYVRLSRTRNGIVIVMGKKRYWVSGPALARVILEQKRWTVVKEVPSEEIE